MRDRSKKPSPHGSALRLIPILAVGLTIGCEGRLAPAQDPSAIESARDEGTPAPLASLPIVRDATRGFPARLALDARELRLNGDGLCEWGIFGIDLYRAALYAERPTKSLEQALRPAQTIVVHLDFVRGLSRAQLRDAFTAAVRANTEDRAGEFAESLDALCSALSDVDSGSTQTFVCRAGGELAVHQDGVLRTTLSDPAFRDLFVQLYLGERPPTAALRDGLLGRGRKS